MFYDLFYHTRVYFCSLFLHFLLQCSWNLLFSKNKYLYQHVSGNMNLWVIAEISAQHVLYEIQCTPRHISIWTATAVQRCWGGCGQSDGHLQCDGEVLHMQGFLGVPTGRNPEEWNQAWSVEAMQWVLLTYPSVITGVVENVSHSTEHHHACTAFFQL
jgi:hypothetical protein